MSWKAEISVQERRRVIWLELEVILRKIPCVHVVSFMSHKRKRESAS